MSIRCSSILVLVLVGLPTFSAGQGEPTQSGDSVGSDSVRRAPVPALSGLAGIDTPVIVENTSANLPQIPEELGGPKLSLALRSESERSNYLQGGLNVGAAYDDNALLESTGAVSNTTYSVFPKVTLQQTFARMNWNLAYAAGLTVNQRFSNRNQGSHDLSFDSQFRLSPHVNLRVVEDFSLTTGFFDSGFGQGFATGNGGPTTNLITPLAKERSSSTVAQADYHFALRDVAGVSGSFYDLHFSDGPAGFALTDTRSVAGTAFWLHGIFGRDWAGVSYRFQRLTFDPSSGETLIHSVMAVNTIGLPGGLALTGFIGPEYSDNQGLVPIGGTAQAAHFSDWSLAGGGDVSWQKDHTSIAGGYSRRINDGGGVLSVIHWQSVHAAVRQQLTPGWTVAAGAGYRSGKSVTVPFADSADSVASTSVNASLARNVGRNLSLVLGYGHDFQDQSGSTNPALQGGAHRNRLFVTLGYQWSRPLGR